MPFIAVVKSSATHVLKYQIYGSKATADTHVRKHGGFVALYPTPPISDYIPDENAKTLTLDQARVDARTDKAAEIQAMRSRKLAAQALSDDTLVTWGALRDIGVV